MIFSDLSMIPKDLSQHLGDQLSIEAQVVHSALERVVLTLEKHFNSLDFIALNLGKSIDFQSQIEAVLEAFLIVLPLKLKSHLLLPALFHVILSRSEDFVFDSEIIRQAYLQFYEEISEKVTQSEISFPAVMSIHDVHPFLTLEMIEADLVPSVEADLVPTQSTDVNSSKIKIIHLLGSAKSLTLALILKNKLKQKKRSTPVISAQAEDFFEYVQISLLSSLDLLNLQIEEGDFFLNQKMQGQALCLLIDDFEFLSRENALNLSLVLQRANFPLEIYIASNEVTRDSFYLKKSIEQYGGVYEIYDLKSADQLLSSVENRSELADLPRQIQLSIEGFSLFPQLPSLTAFEVLEQLKSQMQNSDIATEIFEITCLLGPIFPLSLLSSALNQAPQIIKAQLDFLSFKFAGVDANQQEYYQFGHHFVWLQAIKQLSLLSNPLRISLEKLATHTHLFFGPRQTALSLAIFKRIAFYLEQQRAKQGLAFDSVEWIKEQIKAPLLTIEDAPKLYLPLSTLAGFITQAKPMLWTHVLMVEQAKILSQYAYTWNQVKESIPYLQVALISAKAIKAHQNLAEFLLLLSKFYLLIKSPAEAMMMIESTYPVLKGLQKEEDLILCAYYQVDAYLQLSLLLSAYHHIHSVLEDQGLSYLWQIRFLLKKAEIERIFTQMDASQTTLALTERLWVLMKPADQKKEKAVELNILIQKFLLSIKLKEWKSAQKIKQKLEGFGLLHFAQALIALAQQNFELVPKNLVSNELKNTQYAHLSLIYEYFELQAIKHSRQEEEWESLEMEILWREEMISKLNLLIDQYQSLKDHLSATQLKITALQWQAELFKIKSQITLQSASQTDLPLNDMLKADSLAIFKMMIDLIAISQDLNLPEQLSSIKLQEIPLFLKNDVSDVISFAIESVYRLNSLDELEAQYLVMRQHETQ